MPLSWHSPSQTVFLLSLLPELHGIQDFLRQCPVGLSHFSLRIVPENAAAFGTGLRRICSSNDSEPYDDIEGESSAIASPNPSLNHS